MTAYATVKNAVDCTKLGAVAYLQKPFSPERVNSVLDEILNSTELYKESLQAEENIILKSKNLMAEGRFEDAFDNIKAALALNPYNKEIYKLISEINKNINNFNEAKLFNVYKLSGEIDGLITNIITFSSSYSGWSDNINTLY